mmetsp:Transcript_10550/g.30137  ORF Transcript_10550/g.30137 Transcript_10550/m.30137 type:complete len:276 (+) Transcript_10550:151-978(+)
MLLSFNWWAGGSGLEDKGPHSSGGFAFAAALFARAIFATSISPSFSFVTTPPVTCALLPSFCSFCPSMMHACRMVFSECSVSLLLGDTVAMTTVWCFSSLLKQPRNMCVNLLCRKFTCPHFLEAARMQSLRADREALILAPSFRRSALCSAESTLCSEPARSTRVRMPSPTPSRPCTYTRHMAWEREDWSCTPVAAVARSLAAKLIMANNCAASSTSTSTHGKGCTESSFPVLRSQTSPALNMSKHLSPESSTKVAKTLRPVPLVPANTSAATRW